VAGCHARRNDTPPGLAAVRLVEAGTSNSGRLAARKPYPAPPTCGHRLQGRVSGLRFGPRLQEQGVLCRQEVSAMPEQWGLRRGPHVHQRSLCPYRGLLPRQERMRRGPRVHRQSLPALSVRQRMPQLDTLRSRPLHQSMHGRRQLPPWQEVCQRCMRGAQKQA
jgi:hypothetical protein